MKDCPYAWFGNVTIIFAGDFFQYLVWISVTVEEAKTLKKAKVVLSPLVTDHMHTNELFFAGELSSQAVPKKH